MDIDEFLEHPDRQRMEASIAMYINAGKLWQEKAIELEAKLQDAQERIDSESAFHIEAARLLTIEQAKLSVAVEALEDIANQDHESHLDVSIHAQQALEKINR